MTQSGHDIIDLLHHHIPIPSRDHQERFRRLPIPFLYARSIFSSFLPNDLKNLQYFCLFLGHPRSGTSLLASLLDAHQNAMISHELNVLQLFRYKLFNDQLLYNLIRDNTAKFKRIGRGWSGYNYHVQSQHHDKKLENIAVIGDKKPKATTLLLNNNFELLTEFKREINKPVKFIQCIRNPVQAISSMYKSRKTSLSSVIHSYFDLATVTESLCSKIPESNLLQIHLERLRQHPKQQLKRLCSFFNLSLSPTYLKQSANIVKQPSDSPKHQLPPKVTRYIRSKAKQVSVLRKYMKPDG